MIFHIDTPPFGAISDMPKMYDFLKRSIDYCNVVLASDEEKIEALQKRIEELERGDKR